MLVFSIFVYFGNYFNVFYSEMKRIYTEKVHRKLLFIFVIFGFPSKDFAFPTLLILSFIWYQRKTDLQFSSSVDRHSQFYFTPLLYFPASPFPAAEPNLSHTGSEEPRVTFPRVNSSRDLRHPRAPGGRRGL